MPVQRKKDELYDPDYQIEEGPLFDKQEDNETDVCIVGGDGKAPMIE